jgi:hypothetical protein
VAIRCASRELQLSEALLPLRFLDIFAIDQIQSWSFSMTHADHWREKLDQHAALPKESRLSRSRIMYIESKSEGLEGDAVIARVYFSKSGKTLYYKGLRFQGLKGAAFKADYFDTQSGDFYCISGPRKDQNDRLYGGNQGVLVDDDVRDEYQALIR